MAGLVFWRSVNLTGNQTHAVGEAPQHVFWRSVNLTGNQTGRTDGARLAEFWRSVNLTGNQTAAPRSRWVGRFGAVSI